MRVAGRHHRHGGLPGGTQGTDDHRGHVAGARAELVDPLAGADRYGRSLRPRTATASACVSCSAIGAMASEVTAVEPPMTAATPCVATSERVTAAARCGSPWLSWTIRRTWRVRPAHDEPALIADRRLDDGQGVALRPADHPVGSGQFQAGAHHDRIAGRRLSPHRPSDRRMRSARPRRRPAHRTRGRKAGRPRPAGNDVPTGRGATTYCRLKLYRLRSRPSSTGR